MSVGDQSQGQQAQTANSPTGTFAQQSLSAESHYQLAQVHRDAGRLVDAVLAYRDVIALRSDVPQIYNELGQVLGTLEQQEGACACFQSALALQPDNVEALCHLSDVRQSRAEYAAAADLLRQAVRLQPDDARLHRRLGAVLASWGRYASAIESLQNAVELEPDCAETHCQLGYVYSAREEHESAQVCFERTLDLAANHMPALCGLGRAFIVQQQPEKAISVLRDGIALHSQSAELPTLLGHALNQLERWDEAVSAYEQAIRIDPDSGSARYLLAKVFSRLGRGEEALPHFQAALRLIPETAAVPYHYGNALKSLGRFDESIDAYRAALEIDSDFVPALYDRANAYRHQRRFSEARDGYREVLKRNPEDHAALISLGNVLKSLDDLEQAANSYRQVLRLLPKQPRWELWIATLCPAVFESNDAIDDYRRTLQRELSRISETGVKMTPAEISTSACPVPYNLQFHGRDDLPLKEAYASLFAASFPHWAPPVNSGKPRVGVVVTDGHEGVFLRFIGRVIERLNPDLFDVVIICSQAGAARIRRSLHVESLQTLPIPSRFDETLEIIRTACFDVLYYWETGSDVTNYFLPFFRLAAVQCTSGGVPVTSGAPGMDYFLSNDIVEHEEADAHYSERLILAQSLLSLQSRLTLPPTPKSREQFGFHADQHLYLCPHKIEKFHPDMDPLFAGILRRDDRGVIVIPADRHGDLARKLQDRFARRMPDVIDRIVTLPHQTLPDYLSLTAAADVLLDPLHYGGGLTAYDGFALNKPIVTLPTRFVRGRYTYGFYRKMGMADAVVSTSAEYIEKAVQWGTDAELRREVEQRIQRCSGLLFDADDAARDYENLFLQMIAEARETGRYFAA